MWFDEGIFYQIYPLGFCGAERVNNFGETCHRFGKIEAEIPRLREMGVTAVLFNPLFESERHGYDTVDFFRVDRRLGTNAEFKALVEKFHAAGIRVVLDGVFHHTGREFAPFREVRQMREGTDYRFWFQIDFGGNSPYGDGFSYANWEGHVELVKLRLENCDLQKYLMDAVRFWIDEFQIDGLRLDVCYSLPAWFLELLRRTVREKRQDFFLVGEVIHCGNFAQHLCPERLDSITNYECYKGMVSAFNSNNLFEIEHSLTRLFSSEPWALYTGKRMLNFLDNHDVLRVCTALKDGRNLLPLYTLLFTIPGIPCIYYGSEFGAEGDKSDNDYRLRPCIDELDKTARPDLVAHITALAKIRRESPALCYGSYRKVLLNNTYCAFLREHDGARVIAAFNISNEAQTLNLGSGTAWDLLDGTQVPLDGVPLPAHSSRVLKCM